MAVAGAAAGAAEAEETTTDTDSSGVDDEKNNGDMVEVWRNEKLWIWNL